MTVKFIRNLYKDYLKLGMKVWKDKDGCHLSTKNSMFLSWKISDGNSWLEVMKPYIINNKENK